MNMNKRILKKINNNIKINMLINKIHKEIMNKELEINKQMTNNLQMEILNNSSKMK